MAESVKDSFFFNNFDIPISKMMFVINYSGGTGGFGGRPLPPRKGSSNHPSGSSLPKQSAGSRFPCDRHARIPDIGKEVVADVPGVRKCPIVFSLAFDDGFKVASAVDVHGLGWDVIRQPHASGPWRHPYPFDGGKLQDGIIWVAAIGKPDTMPVYGIGFRIDGGHGFGRYVGGNEGDLA
ncbi:MAG: hypothetical protein KQI78_12315 [Deltaproteobacteria bacterium]|nr:hypothetical protein [Deltaproteobacteria bacterium]